MLLLSDLQRWTEISRGGIYMHSSELSSPENLRRLFQEKGVAAFYQGLGAHLTQYRDPPVEPLTLSHLLGEGRKAFTLSVLSSPLGRLKHPPFSGGVMRQMCQGWPVKALFLLFQSIHSTSDLQRWAEISAAGAARGVFVHTLIHPLTVAKMHQHCLENMGRLFQEKGVAGFYQGLSSQLKQTSQKQMWVWPVIANAPAFLDQYGVEGIYQMFLTGIGIATIDTGFTHRWENEKIKAVLSSSEVLGNAKLLAYWQKLSVNWVGFLVTQKYLRERAQRENPGVPLTLPQLMQVGIQTAFVVSVISAPFDWRNTIVHTGMQHLFSSNVPRNMYRGWPISALTLTIHNIASVFLIDRLS